jgi:hypothetical protein
MNSNSHHRENTRREPKSNLARLALWAGGIVVGAVLLGLGNYIWDVVKPKPFDISIVARDTNGKPLPNVAVWLGNGFPVKSTEARFGSVQFEIPHSYVGSKMEPSINLPGYVAVERQISFVNDNRTQTVVLRKLSNPTVAAAAKVVVQAKPTTRPTAVEPAAIRETKTYNSGPRPSGVGASFSPEYTLCSGAEPSSWTIERSSFVLSGDRQCNAWSTCRPTVQTPTRVCWAFSMQGHNEQSGPFGIGGSGVQLSAGVLSVVWKHS